MRWRVGSRIPINVYEGDRPICQCHTAVDARRIVEVMNAQSRERGFPAVTDAAQKKAALALVGKRVRFAGDPDDEKQYFLVLTGKDGMVTLQGWSGEFAPHLFIVHPEPTPRPVTIP